MKDEAQLAENSPKWLRASFQFVGVAATIGAILFLRHLKASEQNGQTDMPSIELVRRPVERATDFDAKSILTTPASIDIASIAALPRPQELNGRRSYLATERITPFETQVWEVRATVVEAYLRGDGDLCLVLDDKGVRMSAELPNPDFCQNSTFYPKIYSLRQKLVADIAPTARPRTLNWLADLTGVGFYGTAGTRSNGARLEPLLDLKWLKK